MNQTATVTSKMQFTIPMLIAKKIGLKSGDKLTVSEENGKIILTPIKQLIKELSGSLPAPVAWKGKNIDIIIQEAKTKHFQNKKL
jgi:AbrB family looped-hinge helix DNA binding protein